MLTFYTEKARTINRLEILKKAEDKSETLSIIVQSKIAALIEAEIDLFVAVHGKDEYNKLLGQIFGVIE